MELNKKCPVCGEFFEESVGEHIRTLHGEEEFKKAVLKAKEEGLSDVEIGATFGITFKQLQELITQTYGINISVLKKSKKIKYWEPKNFKEETTTVWSFKQRGDWATHDGRYRGNWSPYIPRNIILKYSKPGDLVVDYFVGGGTTAIETKLLGRRCIARDINPVCVGLTLENLKFTPPQMLFTYPIYEPDVKVGDARDLSDIPDNSVDLICAHPPYAGIIKYSSSIEGDLSRLSIEEFLREMRKVAKESYRILKPGKKCVILIGDTRRNKYIIPVGFKTIDVFLEAGFKLKELIIKRQHNCKATGLWYKKSVEYNFLLLAHEYLPVFEKPDLISSSSLKVKEDESTCNLIPVLENLSLTQIDKLESTTVWIFPEEDFEKRLNKNVVDRYSDGKRYLVINFTTAGEQENFFENAREKVKESKLIFIKFPYWIKFDHSRINCYLEKTVEIVKEFLSDVSKGSFLVIQTQDVRVNGYVEPLVKKLIDILIFDNLRLKEIIITTSNEKNHENQGHTEELKITHQYLLVFEVVA
jgi:SAM-dependent methyltransferase